METPTTPAPEETLSPEDEAILAYDRGIRMSPEGFEEFCRILDDETPRDLTPLIEQVRKARRLR